MRHTQQVASPLSSVEQADPMDDIAAIFNDLMQSAEAFAGELLSDFKHPLG